LTLEEFISRTAVDIKTTAVDMTFYYFKDLDPAYLLNLRRLGHDHAVPFAGTACNASLVQADPAARADVLNQIRKWVDATDLLGASHLRIFAGRLPDGAQLSDAVDWVVEGMKAACDYSGQKGIILGLEDHEGVTQTADVCIEIMQRVNSPWAGINLDITNFIDTPTQDAYAQIAACVPYATHVHIRDHFYGAQHLPVDMDRVWQIFAKGGMQGYISAEYEENYPGALPPEVAVPKLVDRIRGLCQKYSSI
jgi:sugar phosphate isomerase/epimerase